MRVFERGARDQIEKREESRGEFRKAARK